MRNGGTCIHDDDMRDILNEILDSDLLIWSFPLYLYGMPAPLKALLDRTLPLSSMAMQKVGERYEHVGQANFSHLRYVMICGCGFPNSRHNFEPAVAQFKLCFPGNHTIFTVPESPMFNAPEAAVVTEPRLTLVRQAGKQYAETGEIDAALLEEICSPMIPEELYAAIVRKQFSSKQHIGIQGRAMLFQIPFPHPTIFADRTLLCLSNRKVGKEHITNPRIGSSVLLKKGFLHFHE